MQALQFLSDLMNFGQNDKINWHNKEMLVYTTMLHVGHFQVVDLMYSHNL